MSLTNAFHESLPYIDQEPTPTELAAATTLITTSLPASSTTTTPHPSLPPLPSPKFTPTFLSLLDQKEPLSSIDLTRYEAQEDQTSSTKQSNLERAYTSHAYLASREQNLHLLESHGKNAWLVANWQLEAQLRTLESELVARRQEIDRLTVERRRAQDEVGGEMKGLEDGWKRAVGRTLEVEAAADGLRREIREAMRARA